jgi:hypothetical protein
MVGTEPVGRSLLSRLTATSATKNCFTIPCFSQTMCLASLASRNGGT